MTIKREKIIIKESPKPGEDISGWTNATPENYERIIWNSINNYNYRA